MLIWSLFLINKSLIRVLNFFFFVLSTYQVGQHSQGICGLIRNSLIIFVDPILGLDVLSSARSTGTEMIEKSPGFHLNL